MSAMRTIFRVAMLLPGLLLAACGGDDEAEPAVMTASLPPGGQEYLVRFGETVRVGPLSLEFTTLAEEGRCPLNATCVWQGNAKILVTASQGRSRSVLELNTFSGHAVSGAFEGYRIELRRLQPDIPWSPRGPPGEYTATLFVEHAGR
jgi:hypothetical protein